MKRFTHLVNLMLRHRQKDPILEQEKVVCSRKIGLKVLKNFNSLTCEFHFQGHDVLQFECLKFFIWCIFDLISLLPYCPDQIHIPC